MPSVLLHFSYKLFLNSSLAHLSSVRSWTSSTMTCVTPLSSASPSSLLSRTPVVQYSNLVADVWRHKEVSQRTAGVSVCCCATRCSDWDVSRYPDTLQADLVAHRISQRLGPLLRHPLSHGDGGDASRLRAEDVGDLVSWAAQRGIQDELRDLSGFTAPAERLFSHSSWATVSSARQRPSELKV